MAGFVCRLLPRCPSPRRSCELRRGLGVRAARCGTGMGVGPWRIATDSCASFSGDCRVSCEDERALGRDRARLATSCDRDPLSSGCVPAGEGDSGCGLRLRRPVTRELRCRCSCCAPARVGQRSRDASVRLGPARVGVDSAGRLLQQNRLLARARCSTGLPATRPHPVVRNLLADLLARPVVRRTSRCMEQARNCRRPSNRGGHLRASRRMLTSRRPSARHCRACRFAWTQSRLRGF